MRKSKILLCHNYYAEPGGESVVFENQLHGLQSMGHPLVVYTKTNTDLSTMRLHEKVTVPITSFYSPRTHNDLKTLIQSEKPDVAIVQNFLPIISPSVYTTLRSMNVPIIQAVYNYRFICPDAHLYSQGEICERCIGGNYIHCVVRRCYRDSAALSAWYASILWTHRRLGTFDAIDQFMVPDDFLGQKLIQGGIPEEKIRKNVNAFFTYGYEPNYTHDNYVVYVGRFIKQKGILTLVKAMQQTTTPIRLLLIGGGILEPEITALIHELNLDDKITLLGTRWGKELEDIVRRATAVVIPSEWYDNLPLVLCQAYALGKPVIASRINGIPEYVDDEVDGFLCEPGDPTALAQAIDRLSTMPNDVYTRIAKSARQKAESTFDFAAHYATLQIMIDELLDKKLHSHQ